MSSSPVVARARVLAVALVVLVATLGAELAVVPVKPASAAAASASRRDVPMLASDPGERRARVPEGGFSDRPGSASDAPSVARQRGNGFDPATSNPVEGEITDRRRVFKNADGSYTAQLSAGPARVRDSSGGWHDTDLSLGDGPTAGSC